MCDIINFTDLKKRKLEAVNEKEIEKKTLEDIDKLESLLSLNTIEESREDSASNYWLESQVDNEVNKIPDILQRIRYLANLYTADITKLSDNFHDIYPHFAYVAFSLALLLLDYTGNDICEYIYEDLPKYTDISYERAMKEKDKKLVRIVLNDIYDVKERLIDSLIIPHLSKMRSVAALILMTDSQLKVIYDCMPNTHKKSQI